MDNGVGGHDPARILIPRPGSPAAALIGDRSGIVAQRRGERVLVYYEGNLYRVESLHPWRQRVVQAAGRLFQRYPTVAMMAMEPEQSDGAFIEVGCIDRDYRIEVSRPSLLAAWLAPAGTTLQATDGAPYRRDENGRWHDGDSWHVYDALAAVVFDNATEVLARC